ncbi:hypothetical protein niasHT_000698 [Heterodera trifolii]|uniref:MATH domain-containing protein n=1 Tax=Heterodera trifolii TaxID=157864 RepID=A0ABD2MCP0_9BILA
MENVLKKGEYSDVQFLFGKGDKKVVPAHKAMCRNDEDQIEIPDIEIGAFKTMLTFIYTKHLNGLDANNWLDVLMAADKYNITELVKECAKFPIEKLPNVFVALEKALLLNMEDFALRCFHYIDQNISALIETEAFLQIGQNVLGIILERDQLRISEIEIWNAALRWADGQYRQNSSRFSDEKRREMLGSALFAIRFPLMPKEEFTKSVVSTNVLTKAEVESIYQHYSHPKLSDLPCLFPLKFLTHQRYKYEDTIEMEIEKVSAFAQEEVGSDRFSDSVEIGGFIWNIMAKIRTKKENNEKWLGFYLYYNDHKNENRSCKSSATLRIVSQKNGTEDLIGRFNDYIFKKENGMGFHNSISFAELLDPRKGFYNKDEDTVKLAINVIVDEPKTEKIISDLNKSNGTLSMEIEKLSGFTLMDPSKGFYNKDEDKVILQIDFTCE